MSESPTPVDESLEALEEKIRRTVELVAGLRDERRRLAEANARLEARSGGAKGHADDPATRIAHLEKERAQWLVEKRAFTRRVEDILAKLEFLESESVPR
jgi:FtsZ-binding cell division protein ZapB